MPAPKAVLRDIHDHGLDPTKAHKVLRDDGRLIYAEEIVKPKLALKRLLDETKVEKKRSTQVETTVDLATVEEQVPEASKKVDASAVEEKLAEKSVEKPVRGSKKVEKHEAKAEVPSTEDGTKKS